MKASKSLLASRIMLVLVAIAYATSSSAQARNGERLPELAFSVAWDATSERTKRGPLFHRVETAFTAANAGDGAGFARFVAPNPDLQLVSSSGAGTQRSPFTIATIRAATESCIGPYSFDEGASWVQLSWVCRVDNEGPLSSIMTFRDSPELSLTIWFEGGLIKKIVAMEPIPVPGRRLVAMNAFAAARGQR